MQHLVNPHLARRQARSMGCLPAGCSKLLLSSLVIILAGGQVAQSQEAPSAPSPEASPAGSTSNGTSGNPSLRPTLNLGSQGAAVSELQSLLKLLGYYPGTVDGRYQESTATAVSSFQHAAQLQPDGVVGTETWNRLLPAAPPVQPSNTQPSNTQPSNTVGTATVGAAPSPASSSIIPPGAALIPVTPAQPATPAAQPSFPTPAVTPAPSPNQSYVPAPAAPATPAPATPAPAPAPAAPTPAPASPAISAAEPVLRIGMTGEAVTRLQQRLQAIGVFSSAIDGAFGSETELAVQSAQRQFSLEPDGVVGPATWEALRP